MNVQTISASQYEHACADLGVDSSFVLSKGNWVRLTNFQGTQKSLVTKTGATFYFDGKEWREGASPSGLVPRLVTFIVHPPRE